METLLQSMSSSGNGARAFDAEGNPTTIQFGPNGRCLCKNKDPTFELTRDGYHTCSGCGVSVVLQPGETAGKREYDEAAEARQRKSERRAQETAESVGDIGLVTCVEPDVQVAGNGCRNCRHAAIEEIYSSAALNRAFSHWFQDFKASYCVAPRDVVDDAIRVVGNRSGLCETFPGRPQLYKASGRSNGLSQKGQEALEVVRATLAAHPSLREAHALVSPRIDKFSDLKAALAAAHGRLQRMTNSIREDIGVQAASAASLSGAAASARTVRYRGRTRGACTNRVRSNARELQGRRRRGWGLGTDIVKSELVNVPLLVRTLERGSPREREAACVAVC